MNRIDRAVIAGLVLVLAVAAFAIGGSALVPTPPQATTGPSTPATEPYREGIVSRPTNVNPLAARTQERAQITRLAADEAPIRIQQGTSPRYHTLPRAAAALAGPELEGALLRQLVADQPVMGRTDARRVFDLHCTLPGRSADRLFASD